MIRHPRFPKDMDLDARDALGDELDTMLAGFPMKRAVDSREHAVTVYAEQLGGFKAVDVREGFRMARAKSLTYAPTPTLVRQCVVEAVQVRLGKTVEKKKQEEEAAYVPLNAADMPNWRKVLQDAGIGIAAIGNGGKNGRYE